MVRNALLAGIQSVCESLADCKSRLICHFTQLINYRSYVTVIRKTGPNRVYLMVFLEFQNLDFQNPVTYNL